MTPERDGTVFALKQQIYKCMRTIRVNAEVVTELMYLNSSLLLVRHIYKLDDGHYNISYIDA